MAGWLERREYDKLLGYSSHPDAKLSVPTPEHFLPLIVVAGAASEKDELRTITEGPDGWSCSMRSIAYVNS